MMPNVAALIRRLLGMLASLTILALLAFVFMRLVPGGPFDESRALPPAVKAALERRYGLELPVLVDKEALREGRVVEALTRTQWARYLGGLARGDLGPSMRYRAVRVNDLIAQAFPVSALLGALGLGLALVLGIPLGLLAAARQGSLSDRLAMALALAGLALPNFVLGGLLIALFALAVPLLPPAGWGGPQHLVLPALTLAAPYVAYIARLTRTGLLEQAGEDFVRTARAKGLGEARVFLGHVLRPGLLPVVSYLGPAMAEILTGSLVVEQLFALPGLGTHFVHAALNRDYAVALGLVLLYSAILSLCNAGVDLAYRWLDPRLREPTCARG